MTWGESLPDPCPAPAQWWLLTRGDPRVWESSRPHRQRSQPESDPGAGRGLHRRTRKSAGSPAACWGPGLRGTREVGSARCCGGWGPGAWGRWMLWGVRVLCSLGPGGESVSWWEIRAGVGRRDSSSPWDDTGGGDCPFFPLPRAVWRLSPAHRTVLVRGPCERVCAGRRGSAVGEAERGRGCGRSLQRGSGDLCCWGATAHCPRAGQTESCACGRL